MVCLLFTAQLFARLYCVSNTKMLMSVGTGLVLYTAKILAEKIGGTVNFES